MIERFGLVIGAMKCGTTSLYRYLCEHPEVAPCREKEPNYFARRSGGRPRDLEGYEALWDWNPRRHAVALEGSTHYTKVPEFPDAAARIAAFDRDFRFVYLVRDPADRIESHITHGLAEGWLEPGVPVERRRDALAISRYATQLARYRRRFDPRRILVLSFRDLVERPGETVERTFEHLGLEPVEVETGAAHNRAKDRLARPLERLAELGDTLPRGMASHLTYLTGAPVGRWQLEERERAFVYRELADDLRRLRDEWGVDVGPEADVSR